MANYNVPGVYIQDLPVKERLVGAESSAMASSSIGVLLGATRSGVVGELQKVNSWTEFVEKFANGLDTPFMENSYLPNSVYGFFQNGGTDLYVGRVAKNDAVKASIASSTTNKLHIEASSVGTWGNGLKVTITKSADYSESEPANLVFDVKVDLGVSDSITVVETTLDDISSKVVESVRWISVFEFSEEVSALAEEVITLSGGSEGTALVDNDYISALSMTDYIEEATLIGLPGQTSETVNSALIEYCDKKGLFPILDMPIGSTVSQVKEYRKSIKSWTGALVYPWGNINDPLSGNIKSVPSVGHFMGLYARTIIDRGISKAPAGVDSVLNGFISLETNLTQEDVSILNPLGVICFVTKPNLGIVSWGARSLNNSKDMQYVTDGMVNLNIKHQLYNNTLFAVFEPSTSVLWSRVETACVSYLEELRQKGVLKGEPDEAYYVVVNSTNNTPESIEEGVLNIEVGYAPNKPAEFVVIKLSHTIGQ